MGGGGAMKARRVFLVLFLIACACAACLRAHGAPRLTWTLNLSRGTINFGRYIPYAGNTYSLDILGGDLGAIYKAYVMSDDGLTCLAQNDGSADTISFFSEELYSEFQRDMHEMRTFHCIIMHGSVRVVAEGDLTIQWNPQWQYDNTITDMYPMRGPQGDRGEQGVKGEAGGICPTALVPEWNAWVDYPWGSLAFVYGDDGMPVYYWAGGTFQFNAPPSTSYKPVVQWPWVKMGDYECIYPVEWTICMQSEAAAEVKENEVSTWTWFTNKEHTACTDIWWLGERIGTSRRELGGWITNRLELVDEWRRWSDWAKDARELERLRAAGREAAIAVTNNAMCARVDSDYEILNPWTLYIRDQAHDKWYNAAWLYNYMNAHVNSTNNPHKVTAAQAGVSSKATTENIINEGFPVKSVCGKRTGDVWVSGDDCSAVPYSGIDQGENAYIIPFGITWTDSYIANPVVYNLYVGYNTLTISNYTTRLESTLKPDGSRFLNVYRADSIYTTYATNDSTGAISIPLDSSLYIESKAALSGAELDGEWTLTIEQLTEVNQ